MSLGIRELESILPSEEWNPAMSNLLNVVYLIALVLASPWLVWQAVAKGSTARGSPRSFWGSFRGGRRMARAFGFMR